MTDSATSISYVKSTTVSDIQSMGVKMATVLHIMAACGAQKSEAEAFANEARSQVGSALKLNDFAYRMERQLSTVTGDRIEDDQQRLKIIASFQQEAEAFGIDTSSWKGNSVSMDRDKAQSIVTSIENMANNCLSNFRNAISKAVDSLGKVDGLMASTIEALKS